MEATLEPVSPELVLVTPGLRSLLVDRGRLEDEDLASPRSPAFEPAPVATAIDRAPRQVPLPAQFLLYAAWQAATGALFGAVAFAVFVGLLLLKPFIA
jgi:hypothetical protein